MKVEVSLRTPWPEGEREEEEGGKVVRGGGGDSEHPPGEGDVTMRDKPEGSLRLLAGKRLSLLAMAPDDGADQDVGGSEGNDELLECSYTGEPPPM